MKHPYSIQINWTGNNDQGTANYKSYERSYDIVTAGKPTLRGSADPIFRGEVSKYNPEELLVAAISSCHMLWYLHLCAEAHITVTKYQDRAVGELLIEADGSGQFTQVDLHPVIEISDPDQNGVAIALHQKVAAYCFIARSVNFPVHHHPRVNSSATDASSKNT